MKAIKITKDGETVGILPKCNEEDTLSNLRNEILEDFGLSNFAYLPQIDSSNSTHTPIDFSEESVLKVRSIAKPIDLDGNCLSVAITDSDELSKRKTTDDYCTSPSLLFPANTTDQYVTKPVDQGSSQAAGTTQVGRATKEVNMFLRRPTSWEIRGVKIYTNEEIEVARGMEKKRRVYWNEMAKTLCRKTKKCKQDIARLIDEAWRKEQTGLLLEANKLIQAAETKHGTNTVATFKPNTIEKNVLRIQNNQQEIEKINTSIKEIEEDHKRSQGTGKLKRKNELQELQRAKKFHLSDLKKAQDVMRKNLKKKVNST